MLVWVVYVVVVLVFFYVFVFCEWGGGGVDWLIVVCVWGLLLVLFFCGLCL